jgi:acylphosphatase
VPPSSSQSAVLLLIRGRVQGVGFRFYAQDVAEELRLAGWVRNLPDGSVEAYAEGPRADLDAFIDRIRQGPPLSRVEAVTPAWQTPQGTPPPFSIR